MNNEVAAPETSSICYQRQATVKTLRCAPISQSDDSRRTSFDRWGYRKSRDIKEAAQLLLNDTDPDPKRLVLNLSADDAEGIKVDSFEVVPTTELIDFAGKSAAIIEKNFQSDTARRLADRTLVPVYTICDGVLRIIPKLLDNSISTHIARVERGGHQTDLKMVKQRISEIVNGMNEPPALNKANRIFGRIHGVLYQCSRRKLGKIALIFATGLILLLCLISAAQGRNYTLRHAGEHFYQSPQ